MLEAVTAVQTRGSYARSPGGRPVNRRGFPRSDFIGTSPNCGALPLTPTYIALRYNAERYSGATMMSSSKERHSRLGWVELHILLALADADMHGYAIMQKVSHDTSGRIR